MDKLALDALRQIVIMFFIIIVGVVCYKKKMIDKDTNKKLADLVLMIVNPTVIFISYQREFEAGLLKGLLISLVLAVITHIFAIFSSKFVVRGKKYGENISLERFAAMYSNCGFIGIPLVKGIFGNEGVFYITAYITVFNLLVWTHGVILMTGKRDMKTVVKAFSSPSVIATLLGFVFFMARIILPGIMIESISYIGNMNTPLAMLVAGATIAQTDIKRILTKFRIYYISLIKLVFIPITMLLLFNLFDVPKVVLLTSVLAAGCPTAVTVNLFAIRYGKDYLYASELFAVTTILSAVTIPIVMIIGELLV